MSTGSFTAAGCANPVSTTLPALPAVNNVTANVRGNGARIRFGAVSGAKDYRIYALPANQDVAVNGGLLTVQNAIYRCAGVRFDVNEDERPVITEIEWPDLHAGSVLVIEALDAGCPFSGHLSTRATPPEGAAGAFVTPENARKAGTNELFINGQFAPSSAPKPVARAFVCLEPGPKDTMDWFQDFEMPVGPLTDLGVETDGDAEYVHLQTSEFDISFYQIEGDKYSFGSFGQELWIAYADWAADVPGKVRATVRNHTGTLSDTTFVHATMTVDAISTGRRYPQLWLSTMGAPVQKNMASGVVFNLQTIQPTTDSFLQLQLCEHEQWGVQEQCGTFVGEEDLPNPDAATAVHLPVRFDLFVSTQRAYAFYNGQPYYCGLVPDGLLQAGQALHMTIGDNLYHSGADEVIFGDQGSVDEFRATYQGAETRRNFDNLGLSSGVAAPAWTESAIPCTSEREVY